MDNVSLSALILDTLEIVIFIYSILSFWALWMSETLLDDFAPDGDHLE